MEIQLNRSFDVLMKLYMNQSSQAETWLPDMSHFSFLLNEMARDTIPSHSETFLTKEKLQASSTFLAYMATAI